MRMVMTIAGLALLAQPLAALGGQDPAPRDFRGEKGNPTPGEYINVPEGVGGGLETSDSFSLIKARPKAPPADQLEALRAHAVATNALPPGGGFSATGELQYLEAVSPVRMGENGLWFARFDGGALMVKVEKRGEALAAIPAVARDGQVREYPAVAVRPGARNRLSIPGGFTVVLTPTLGAQAGR